MFPEILPENGEKILSIMTNNELLDNFYLAGGTRNHISLSNLFTHFDDKYSSTYNRYHIIKSLVYFEDAEKDKKPEMIKPVDWEQVKKYFTSQEKDLFSRYY